MTVDKPTSIVPECRFPEFRSAGDWHLKPLSEIAAPISDRAGTTKCLPMSITTGIGLVSQEEKFGHTIAGNSYKNYIRLQMNDFAYNKSATKEFPQGYIARYSGTKDAAVPNSIFACFRPDIASVIPEYLDHLFHRNYHGQWLRKYITIGARAHGALSVSNDDLMSMPVPLPPDAVSGPEQQKIADCLGSLDELIAAEGRKLEALRQHKQGLMQQLFPEAGETVPKLRFPEFRHEENWEEKRLGDLGALISGLTYSPKDVREGGLLVLRSSNIQNGEIALDDCVYVRLDIDGVTLTQPDDILICVRNGSRSLIGKSAIVPKGMPACTHGAFMTIFRASDPHFARVLLQTTAFHKQVVADLGATINSINKSRLLKYRFIVPKAAEQKKIADCLGSLDDRIATESRKLEALRQHKQGLVQQLFPVPERQ